MLNAVTLKSVYAVLLRVAYHEFETIPIVNLTKPGHHAT